METRWCVLISIMVVMGASVVGCERHGLQPGDGGEGTRAKRALEVPGQPGGSLMHGGASGQGGNGGGPTDGASSTTVDRVVSSMAPAPDKCQQIARLPAGIIPVCYFTGGKPKRPSGCSMFPVHLFMDAGSYYFETYDSREITQCPRDRLATAIEESTGTYAGAVQESLSVTVLEGGLVSFRCRVYKPDGPGWGYEIMCSDTGIQIVPPDKGVPWLSLEFPGTAATPSATGYLGWLYPKPNPDCRNTGVPPQINYTSLLGLPDREPLLGSQPVNCVPSVDGMTLLFFNDLLCQQVTLTFDDEGVVRSVQWQKSPGG